MRQSVAPTPSLYLLGDCGLIPYLEVLTLTLWPRKPVPLAQLATCPACQCDVFVRVLVAYRLAGERREVAGDVCECVRCGQRVTVLTQGGIIAYGRNRVGAPSNASNGPAGWRVQPPGGEGTEGGGALFGDMVTNLDGRDF